MGNRIQYEAYGIWNVTTEGDCEGRTTTQLGIHEGFIDEIAFALADKSGYSLTFKQVENVKLDMTPKKDSVHVQLDIDSGTWSMTKESRNKYATDMFDRAGRSNKVKIENSNYYGSFKIVKETAFTPEQKMIRRLKKAGFNPSEVIQTFRQR